MTKRYRTDGGGHAFYKEKGNIKSKGIRMQWISACGRYFMDGIGSESPKSTQENVSCSLCKTIIKLGDTDDE